MGESWEGGVIVGGQERRVVWIDRGRTDWCIGNASKSIYSLLRSAAKNNMKDDNHSDSEIRFSSVLLSSFGFVEKNVSGYFISFFSDRRLWIFDKVFFSSLAQTFVMQHSHYIRGTRFLQNTETVFGFYQNSTLCSYEYSLNNFSIF